MQRKRSGTYLGLARSTCPDCLRLIDAKIMTDGSRVYFDKYCPEHGRSGALVSEDLEYWLKAREFAAPGSVPGRFSTEVSKGCPDDCGLCPGHQQHTCHPIVEITDHCNLNCPVCFVENRARGFLETGKFKKIVDGLIASEGRLENITFSGGEPSLHPDFFELADMADRPEVARVSLVTNGIRIADDTGFCELLKSRDIYVILQWDGPDDDIHARLRGRPLADTRERALSNLETYGIATQLIYTAARGVNEDRIGTAVRLMLEKEHILSLSVQPLVMSGDFGDPMDRITVPGVIRALAEQTDGILRKEDFIPLPCSNPECVSLTYLLALDGGDYVPFPRFADMRKYLHLLRSSATIEPNYEVETALHEIIADLWSTAGEVPDNERVTRALRRAVMEMFPAQGETDRRELIRASERQAKSVFIHHYMDRHNFDLARVVKCCHHYPRPDGKIMPICAFNLFHRETEELWGG